MNKRGKSEPDAILNQPSHLVETISKAVHESCKKYDITRAEVETIVGDLNLHKTLPGKVPRLVVRRLRFQGVKTLDGATSQIDYDQTFESGVNFLLIEHNLVGKSTVFKTIKFALTGNDDDYDAVVRQWLHEIWLEFTLGDSDYTVLLSRHDDGLRGKLATGRHQCRIDELPQSASVIFDYQGNADIQTALQDFFFSKFALPTLGWNQATTGYRGGNTDVTASWRTYFQALRVPDDNHSYLLSKHANQDGLLFSAFLGLTWNEPLNQLSMAASSIKKRIQAYDEEPTDSANAKRELHQQLADALAEIKQIEETQSTRLAALTDPHPIERLTEVNAQIVAASSAVDDYKAQRDNLKTKMQTWNARARRLREQIMIGRALTGLNVTFCPNCDHRVAPEEVKREEDGNSCRLCDHPVGAGNESDLEAIQASAENCEKRAKQMKAEMQAVNAHIRANNSQIENCIKERERLKETIKSRIAVELPTALEKENLGTLHQTIGRIEQQLATLENEDEGQSLTMDRRQVYLIDKVKKHLQEHATCLNREIHQRLAELVMEIVTALQANQISGLNCSPMGAVKLTKNGQQIPFSGIKNPGERYRVKLAVLLALIRLGSETEYGRHPGLLMLDQLGATEMVSKDLRALAASLNTIDESYSDSVQIIAFTSCSEFRNATDPAKVYGHRVEGDDGKLYAF